MRSGLPWAWGTTPADLARSLPVDAVLPERGEGAGVAMDRAVPVAAPAPLTWRWLCQTAVAPYSYDLVDNLGRRSPRELTPGAERLEVGQRMLGVYQLLAVDEGRSWTGVTTASASRPLGPIGVTYAVVPDDDAGAGPCRLVCRMTARGATRPQRLRAAALAWGDLVMMRKQLLTLAALAERDARR